VRRYPSLARRRRYAGDLRGGSRFDVDANEGFKVLLPYPLPVVREVVEAARTIARRTDLEQLDWPAGKDHMNTRLLRAEELTLESPWLRFGLNEEVLWGVARYLGCVPTLSYAGLWCSRYIDSPHRSSQLYHVDPEGPSQLKVFVYCSDVEPRNGPLAVVGARMSEVLRRRLHQTKRRSRRIPDGVVDGLVGEGVQQVLLGATGTVCLVDTSRCYHFGSRIERDAGPRLVAVLQFLTPLAPLVATPFRHLSGPSLSPIQRLVLGDG
jgi:hypothetical protein